jgi:hypothetical protein
MNIREQFEQEILSRDWSECYAVHDSGYFRDVTTSMNYWQTHMHAFETVGISELNFNTNWLDIGTWFGVMPWAMRQLGFLNIDTTDCLVHRMAFDEQFQKLWPMLGIDPQELHIQPNKQFLLDKKYDIITVMKSNVFWKTEDVIAYDGSQVRRAWQNEGADGKFHTYFTVYNTEEWDYFINLLKLHLNPGGVAIVNPEPWVYDSFENLHTTRDYLQQYQQHEAPGELSNYLVIRR